MDLGLDGRVALVSGASAGLGRAIAAELAAEGARVAISSRSRERIDAAAAGIGATGFVWDTADVDAAPELLDEVASAFGEPVSIVVANTGGPPPGEDPLAFGRDQWEAAYRSLVLAPMALVEHAMPAMRAAGYGRVVSVASLSVREPIARLMLSSAHRAALVTSFKTIAQRVAGDGVTLNTVLPGSFATDRLFSGFGSEEEAAEHARRTIPAARLGDPAELAALVAFVCSPRAAYLTGETIAMDGGATRSVF